MSNKSRFETSAVLGILYCLCGHLTVSKNIDKTKFGSQTPESFFGLHSLLDGNCESGLQGSGNHSEFQFFSFLLNSLVRMFFQSQEPDINIWTAYFRGSEGIKQSNFQGTTGECLMESCEDD